MPPIAELEQLPGRPRVNPQLHEKPPVSWYTGGFFFALAWTYEARFHGSVATYRVSVTTRVESAWL